MLSSVARHVPTEDDEDCRGDSAGLDAVVDEVAEAFFGPDIAENDAVEELAFESF